jgi:hypothetical protein
MVFAHTFRNKYHGFHLRGLHILILWTRPKSKLFYDRRSVGQSVLVSGHHLGSATNFSFSFTEIIFRRFRFLFNARLPLWREYVSGVYNCYGAFPALSFSGPSAVELVTISQCLVWEWVTSYD